VEPRPTDDVAEHLGRDAWQEWQVMSREMVQSFGSEDQAM